MIELVHEHTYASQHDTLIGQFPRLREALACAEWQIASDYTRFSCVDATSHVYVWRSDDSEIAGMPTVEVAYFYSVDDGMIHLLGTRMVSNDEP